MSRHCPFKRLLSQASDPVRTFTTCYWTTLFANLKPVEIVFGSPCTNISNLLWAHDLFVKLELVFIHTLFRYISVSFHGKTSFPKIILAPHYNQHMNILEALIITVILLLMGANI